MPLALVNVDALCVALAVSTHLPKERMLEIVQSVQASQHKHHAPKCAEDPQGVDMCEALYLEKVDYVLGLRETLTAIQSLAGEDKQINSLITTALRDYGPEFEYNPT